MEDFIHRCTECGKLCRLTSISGTRPEEGREVQYYCPYCRGTLAQGKSLLKYIPDTRCYIDSDYGEIEVYHTHEEDGALCVAMRNEKTDYAQVDLFLNREEAKRLAKFILDSMGDDLDD